MPKISGKSLARAALFLGVGWMALFLILGVRRWMCAPPWGGQCFTNFGSAVEASVLLLWVKDRESLVAAVLALIAAGLGVTFLQKQIKQTDELEQQRRARRLLAARAVLPLALTEICDFAVATMEMWLRARVHVEFAEMAQGVDVPDIDLVPPSLSPDVAPILRAVIEDGDEDIQAALMAILHQTQVRIARSRDLRRDIIQIGDHPGQHYIIGEVLETAELYALASALFGYARDALPVPAHLAASAQGVRVGLHSAGVNEMTEAEVWEAYRRLYQAPPPAEGPIAADERP